MSIERLHSATYHKSTSSVSIESFKRGKTIRGDDMKAIATAAKAPDNTFANLAKGHQGPAVGGAPVFNLPPQDQWIRALSLDNAPRWAHMHIVNGSFACGQVQLTVTKISDKLPKNGVGFFVTNGQYALRKNKGGWVKMINLNRPQRGRGGKGRGKWGPSPPPKL